MGKNKNEKPVTGTEFFLCNLTIAFIVLKLCGVIAWSWLWVLSPLWIPALFVTIVFIIAKIIK